MLSGHAIRLHHRSDSNELLLENPVSDEEEGPVELLYTASFEELANSHVQYDTVLWVVISVLLVLAWGVGILMLLYLPYRRYVLQKDIVSRKLYVTPEKIVYKATRPSFIPFVGLINIRKHIPLHLVIDIIIEQGCLQSVYGIHTFRIESKAYGKPSPIEELQLQGVSNPGLLRKVIIKEAAKCIQEFRSQKPAVYAGEEVMTPTTGRASAEVPSINRLQSSSLKMMATPRHTFSGVGNLVPGELLLLHKIEEVQQSVKKIEYLVARSQSLAQQEAK